MKYNRLQVGIKPKNTEESLTFYRDILEFPYLGALHTSGTILHRFEVGGSILKIAEGEAVEVKNPLGTPFDASGLRWISLDVDELDTLVEKLKAKDASFVTPIVSDEHGVRFAIIEDPDGIWVELIESK